VSHNFTCSPTQASTPYLNLSQYSIYLPRRDGRLSAILRDMLSSLQKYPKQKKTEFLAVLIVVKIY